MGTFIPITMSLIAINGLNAGSVLFFAGLFNLFSGIIYGIPISVQPMKAIAAIALTENLSANQIYAAGIGTGIIFFLLGITGLIDKLHRIIPMSVVRGIQLGIGAQLLMKGFGFIAGGNTWWGYDGITVGILGTIAVMLLFGKKTPGALFIFIYGLILTILKKPTIFQSIHLEISVPTLVHFSFENYVDGFMKAGLPQLPLTLLNSVIAVSALSFDLFPTKGATNRSISTSVGLMNIVGGFFGGMPMCHGAGGLAGQYKFGARTGGSMVFLGTFKMLFGLTAAGTIFLLMQQYPRNILGVLLLFSGMELALLIRDQTKKTPMFIVLITATAILTMKTFIGFIIGIATAYLFYYEVVRIEEQFDPKELIKVYKNEK